MAIQKSVSGSSISIQVRLDELAPPPKVYHCTMTAVESVGPQHLALIFGEQWPGERTLSSALYARMPKAPLASALFEGTSSFVPDLIRHTEQKGTFEASADRGSFDYPSGDRRAIENVSVVNITYTDDLASMRFYRVSAPEFRKWQADGKTNFMTPSFEVVLSTGQLAGLIKAAVRLLKDQEEVHHG